MVAETADIRCHCPYRLGLTGSTTSDSFQLGDTLQRFTIAAGDLLEDLTFTGGQLLAHAGNQERAPSRPAFAREDVGEQLRVAKCFAQGDGRLHEASPSSASEVSTISSSIVDVLLIAAM